MQRRNTHQRQLVLNIVKELDNHPTADEIYVSARAQDPKISRGTVYRNLALLSDEGSIISVRIGGVAHYDHRTHDHAHLTCISCGKLIDVPLDTKQVQKAQKAIQQNTGYLVHDTHVTFEGVCPECQAALQEQKQACSA